MMAREPRTKLIAQGSNEARGCGRGPNDERWPKFGTSEIGLAIRHVKIVPNG
jgi:hypothetical protein